jgi:hypothetical protein
MAKCLLRVGKGGRKERRKERDSTKCGTSISKVATVTRERSGMIKMFKNWKLENIANRFPFAPALPCPSAAAAAGFPTSASSSSAAAALGKIWCKSAASCLLLPRLAAAVLPAFNQAAVFPMRRRRSRRQKSAREQAARLLLLLLPCTALHRGPTVGSRYSSTVSD